MKIFQKNILYHKHLGSSWYILGLSWFLILSPVWIVIWCFFVETCWKHETVRTKCQSCQSPWQLRFEQFRFDLVASSNWHFFFETSGWQYETCLSILFFAPLMTNELILDTTIPMIFCCCLTFHFAIILFCLRKKFARCQWPWNPAVGWLHPWHNDRTMHDHGHTPCCPKHPTSKAMCVEKSLGSSSGKAMPQPEVAALLKLWEYGQVVSPKSRCDCMLKHKQFSGVKTSVFLNNVHWFFSLTTLHSSRAHECATLKDHALLCGKTSMLENIESWSQPVQSKSIKHIFKKMLQNEQCCKTM